MQIEDLWTTLENAVQDLNDKSRRASQKDLEEIKSLSSKAYDVLKVLHQLEWLESNKMEWNGEEIAEQDEITNRVLLEEESVIEEEEIEEEVQEAVEEIEQQIEETLKMVMPSIPASGQSLADKLGQSKVQDLTKAFGISEKFLFMNELFEGDSESYKKALNTLNNFSSWDEAEKELLNLSNNYNWDQESEYVNRFMTVVERRYA